MRIRALSVPDPTDLVSILLPPLVSKTMTVDNATFQ